MSSVDPGLDPRRSALEDLRTADRIIASVLGTLRSLERDQLHDLFGAVDSSDGLYGDVARDEVGSAQLQLNEAEAHLRRAAERMGHVQASTREDLQAPGVLEVVFDGLFDILALRRVRTSLEITQRLHDEVRALFELLRSKDPLGVEPLADWDQDFSRGTLDEIEIDAAYKRPQVIVRALVFLAIVALVFSPACYDACNG